jgi:enoyl-CoA hydratase
VREGIGRATFNRPQARNAFTFEMYERLAQICEQPDKDRSIKVLVFQGAGDKAFASGTDINQFRAFKTPEHAIEYESRIDRVLTTIEECRVPTIAAITGACTGGGAGIGPAAICASGQRRHGSDFRSPARSAIVFRCQTSAGLRH